MDLPKNIFFEILESSVTAIHHGRVYLGTTFSKKAIDHRLHLMGKIMKMVLDPSDKTLRYYDNHYYNDNKGFREIKNLQIERRKKALGRINRSIESIEGDICLDFIENWVFPKFNPHRKKLVSDTNKFNTSPLEINLDDLMLLSNYFSDSSYLILGKRIYKLEEELNQPKGDYAVFFGKPYNIIPHTTLELFIKEYYVDYNLKLNEILKNEDNILNTLNENEERVSRLLNNEYSEPTKKDPNIYYGFIKHKNEWYVWEETPPHVFKYENKFLLFEKVKVGVKIPIDGYNIGDIDIGTQEPIVFDDSYVHPALRREKGFRYICYKGSNPKETNKSIKKEFKNINPDTEIITLEDRKARWVKHIIDTGISTLLSGNIRDDVAVWYTLKDMLRDGYGHTKKEYELWKKVKEREGHKINPKLIGNQNDE